MNRSKQNFRGVFLLLGSFLILFREVGRIAEEVERFMPFIAVCKAWSGYI
jgi:hypothetical protein